MGLAISQDRRSYLICVLAFTLGTGIGELGFLVLAELTWTEQAVQQPFASGQTLTQEPRAIPNWPDRRSGESHQRRHMPARVTDTTRTTGMPLLLSLLIGMLFFAPPSFAEWKVSGESNIYYTDDAALFSATR